MVGGYYIDELEGRLKHYPDTFHDLQQELHPVHLRIADYVKHPLMICANIESLYTQDELRVLFAKSNMPLTLSDEERSFLPPILRFISDGRRAFIKRIEEG